MINKNLKLIGMVIAVALTSLFSTGTLSAQAPDWAWAKGAGGAGKDEGRGICKDPDGNIYATGLFTNASVTFGTTSLSNAGGADAFLVKYDAAGNVLWAKSFGSTGDDWGFAVSCDAQGNVYMMGRFSSLSLSFGATTLTNHGNFDVCVVKLDANGNVLWAKGMGGNSDEFAYGMTVDNKGNAYITGRYFSASLTFASTTITQSGAGDMFLAKYDASGNEVWIKNSTGGNNFDSGLDLVTDATGDVYVSGHFQSRSITLETTTLLNNSSGSNADLFIAKYDGNGNLIWAKSAGGSGIEYGYGLGIDANGLYLAGWFSSPSFTLGAFPLTNASPSGTFDVYISKMDFNGNFIWAKTLGGSNDEACSRGLSVDGAGNVYMSGQYKSPSLSFGGSTVTNSGIADIFVVKYDNNGNEQWIKNTGGSGDEFGYGIVADIDGNAYITGYFFSPSIAFDATTLTNAVSNLTTSDIFVAKLGCTKPEFNLGKDTTICRGDSIILKAPSLANARNTWSNGSTDSLISVTASGKYWLTVNKNGCIGSDTIVISTKGPIVDLGKDTIICEGESVTLKSIASYINPVYLWSTGDMTPSITIKQPGVYELSVTDDGCVGKGTVEVTVADITVDLGPDTTLCDGKPYTLKPLNPSYEQPAYQWSNGATSSSIAVNQSGTYGLTVTDLGCRGSDSVTLNFPPPFQITLGNDTVLCHDGTINLRPVPQLSQAAYKWNTGASTPTLPVDASGSYWVRVTDKDGCSQYDTVKVTYVHLNQYLGEDTVLCRERPVDLTLLGNVPDGANVLWSTGATTPDIHVTDKGTYWVTVTYPPCTGTDTIRVGTIRCDCQPQMPNAFSPNGDGINDVFLPVMEASCPIRQYQFRVYNRYGQMVFQSNKPDEGWDGTYGNKGKPADPGTYMYILTYSTLINPETTVKRGDVTIVR